MDVMESTLNGFIWPTGTVTNPVLLKDEISGKKHPEYKPKNKSVFSTILPKKEDL